MTRRWPLGQGRGQRLSAWRSTCPPTLSHPSHQDTDGAYLHKAELEANTESLREETTFLRSMYKEVTEFPYGVFFTGVLSWCQGFGGSIAFLTLLTFHFSSVTKGDFSH